MARIRSIKPEFWEDERLGLMPRDTRLVFLALISLADDEGRLRGSPEFVRSRAFPYDASFDVAPELDRLARAGRIRWYRSNGERLIEVLRFREHQKIDKPSKSQLDPFDPELSEEERAELSPKPRRDLAEDSTTDRKGMDGSGGEGISLAEFATPPPKQESIAPAPPPGVDGPAPTELTRPQGAGDLFQGPPPPTDAERVFAYWQEQSGHTKAKPDAKRMRAVRSRLKDGYTAEDLMRAVDGCLLTPHNQGKNDRGEAYDDLELICRDGPHVDRFMRNATSPPTGSAGRARGIAATDADKDWSREKVILQENGDLDLLAMAEAAGVRGP